MKTFLMGAASILAAAAVAAPASAGTVLVNFDFLSGGSSAASGNFTYDSAKTGVIGWSDLLSYQITFPGANSYDLAFVNSGGDSVYDYLGFDTATHSFVTADIAGFPQIMSDIKDSFNGGFFLRDDAAYRVGNDYGPGSHGQFSFDTLNVSVSGGAVPEPAEWALMLSGFALIGATLRRARPALVTA